MRSASQEKPAADRLSTGIAGLDDVLKGGLLSENLYLIMGAPGAGKTVMANQIACFHAARGRKVVFITLLAESHGAMVQHLRGFSFFRPELIPDSLTYYSGFKPLEEGGLPGLLDFILQTLQDEHPDLMVLDGMAAIEATSETEMEFKRFVHQMQGMAPAFGCTGIMVTHLYHDRGPHPEHTMVDGIVYLHSRLVGVRGVRELEIRKIRGTDYLRGKHFFNITGNGIEVYPRTEVLYARPRITGFDGGARASFGIAELDAMLGGGLHAGSTAAVIGNAGSGKTMLGLHFLAQGAGNGEAGVHVSLGEPPPEVIAKGDGIGLGLGKAVDEGRLKILWEPAVETLLDPLAQSIIGAIEESNATRLFLDGIQVLDEVAVYPDRILRFLTAFTNELRSRGITTLLATETSRLSPADPFLLPVIISSVAGTVIRLRQVELGAQTHRLIGLVKMRQGAHRLGLHEFTISSRGIQVEASTERARSILSGSPERPGA